MSNINSQETISSLKLRKKELYNSLDYFKKHPQCKTPQIERQAIQREFDDINEQLALLGQPIRGPYGESGKNSKNHSPVISIPSSHNVTPPSERIVPGSSNLQTISRDAMISKVDSDKDLKLAHFRSELENRDSVIERKDELLATLTATINDLRSHVQRANSNADNANENILKLRADLDRIIAEKNDEKSQLLTTINDLRSQIQRTNDNLDNLRSDLDHERSQNASIAGYLNSQIQLLNETHKSSTDKLNQEIISLKSQVHKFDRELDYVYGSWIKVDRKSAVTCSFNYNVPNTVIDPRIAKLDNSRFPIGPQNH